MSLAVNGMRAFVLFSSAKDAQQAVHMFQGYEWLDGRKLALKLDTSLDNHINSKHSTANAVSGSASGGPGADWSFAAAVEMGGLSVDESAGDEGDSSANNKEKAQVHVCNLPFIVGWQDLKDLFREAGTVLRSDIRQDGKTNKSKGVGSVIFANAKSALKAVELFDGFEWFGRKIEVRIQDGGSTTRNSATHLSRSNDVRKMSISSDTGFIMTHDDGFTFPNNTTQNAHNLQYPCSKTLSAEQIAATEVPSRTRSQSMSWADKVKLSSAITESPSSPLRQSVPSVQIAFPKDNSQGGLFASQQHSYENDFLGPGLMVDEMFETAVRGRNRKGSLNITSPLSTSSRPITINAPTSSAASTSTAGALMSPNNQQNSSLLSSARNIWSQSVGTATVSSSPLDGNQGGAFWTPNNSLSSQHNLHLQEHMNWPQSVSGIWQNQNNTQNQVQNSLPSSHANSAQQHQYRPRRTSFF